MKHTKYSTEIVLENSPDDVFKHLINLSKWWPEDFEGECLKLNSEFVLRTGDSHYSKNKVIEFEQDKKLVWLTTEALRKPDNFDWTGTKMIFELTLQGENTRIRFIYDGVVLENESDRLVQICEFTLKDKFYSFITHDKPHF